MTEPRLTLVPLPRQVTQQPGIFHFRAGRQVVLDPSNVQAMLGSAWRLQEALDEETGIAVEIVVGEIGDPGAVAVSLAVDTEAVSQEQGYNLEVKPERVAIVGHDSAGVFYGVCTLNQLIRQFGAALPCLSIADYPDFPARGVMLDVSRCRVPTVDTLFELVDMLAGFKVNQVQLYTEHTFAYREHPEAWANASPITGQEILELDVFCQERFVELVPNQNSFGHLVPWLTHPKYNDLAEAPDGFEWAWGGRSSGPFSLNPTDPRSLELLGSMYDDLLPHFSSELFNVGCDETHDLGQGRSKAVCEEKGVHRVYLDFLLEIHKLVEERGRTMMFWGDIILHEPELIPELPKDAIALEWGYEADHPFDERCEKFASAGIPFYVCPGTSSWNAIAGQTDNAMGNLRNAAESGLKHGAIGYLNTDWGDHDHWQHLSTAYLGYVYGAAVSWALEANADLDLAPALSLHAFDDPSGTMGQVAYDLGNVYKVYERLSSVRIHNASFLVRILYAPVEQLHTHGVDWKQVAVELFAEARREIDAAMSLMSQVRMRGADAGLIRREYEHAARVLRHGCGLGELKVRLATAETPEQRAEATRQAGALAEDMRGILDEHRLLWLARNRPGGLEKGSGRHFREMIEAYRRIEEGA